LNYRRAVSHESHLSQGVVSLPLSVCHQRDVLSQRDPHSLGVKVSSRGRWFVQSSSRGRDGPAYRRCRPGSQTVRWTSAGNRWAPSVCSSRVCVVKTCSKRM